MRLSLGLKHETEEDVRRFHLRFHESTGSGLALAPMRDEDLFYERLFPRRVGLPAELEPLYNGTIRARPEEICRPYQHKTTFAN